MVVLIVHGQDDSNDISTDEANCIGKFKIDEYLIHEIWNGSMLIHKIYHPKNSSPNSIHYLVHSYIMVHSGLIKCLTIFS